MSSLKIQKRYVGKHQQNQTVNSISKQARSDRNLYVTSTIYEKRTWCIRILCSKYLWVNGNIQQITRHVKAYNSWVPDSYNMGDFFINCDLLFCLQPNFPYIAKINSHKMEPRGICELRIQTYWSGSFLGEMFVVSASYFVTNIMDTSWGTIDHTADLKTPPFYRTRSLSTVFTRARHCFLTLSKINLWIITGL
jgi:hypothetical protein